MRGDAQSAAAGLDPGIVPVLRELGDLKRVTSAELDGSLAARMFLRAWGRLAEGEEVDRVAYASMAGALAAGRLGALDGDKLRQLGLDREEARAVLRRAVSELSAPLDDQLKDRLNDAVPVEQRDASHATPAFAHALARQPRAGVTCPGRARIMLQPEENHADHCLIVAVYAGLLAPAFGADPVRAWWFGMSHHLHSAAMPDAGYTGEMLLEPHLSRVMEEARRQALAELSGSLRALTEPVFEEIAEDRTPEARAFHAADVIDRVLEIDHHLGAAAVTMGRVLNEYELVHASPVKAFHDQVLAAVRLP